MVIGDADQLPPVGAGKPFADLIDSGRVPVARLTQVFRQAARSLIVQAAHAINRGEPPRTQATENELRDFFFVEKPGDADAADEIVALATERLPPTTAPTRSARCRCSPRSTAAPSGSTR